MHPARKSVVCVCELSCESYWQALANKATKASSSVDAHTSFSWGLFELLSADPSDTLRNVAVDKLSH